MHTPRVEDLKGSVALVTGSSREIGRAIALSLARTGADIALNFRSRSSEAAAVESEIRALGARCVSIQADVSSASEVAKLIAHVEESLGPVEVLVNNAGIS